MGPSYLWWEWTDSLAIVSRPGGCFLYEPAGHWVVDPIPAIAALAFIAVTNRARLNLAGHVLALGVFGRRVHEHLNGACVVAMGLRAVHKGWRPAKRRSWLALATLAALLLVPVARTWGGLASTPIVSSFQGHSAEYVGGVPGRPRW
ncbi:MAG TPA: hypothetical protein QGF58_18675 [Myxococcota bacterium]|nr:hypothetical protein [Myxococcota bacterium]